MSKKKKGGRGGAVEGTKQSEDKLNIESRARAGFEGWDAVV